MKLYGVIMAGGGGTRFWPLSRQKKPKQLLNISGNGLMINETIDRIVGIIGKENIFIVTHVSQADKMKACVGERIAEDHILMEPLSRNTAACIGYAAEVITERYGDGVMCIFPSDHFIKNLEEFTKVLRKAIEVAYEQDKLVTIGIRPTYPSTGYGYIHYTEGTDQAFYEVDQFIEKPNLETAKEYLERSGYAWNSGMFLWKASTILDNMKRFLPKLYHSLEELKECLGDEQELLRIYSGMPGISIDYGILERSDDVVVIPGDFGWSDVGSWDNLGAIYDEDDAGNIIRGEQINIETKNCICYSDNRLIATIGIEDIIVAETEDAVLVCRKDQAQKVKEVVELLKTKGLVRYLA